MEYADIAVEANIGRVFTYSVPEPIRESVSPGVRVKVPFRNREITGYVVGEPRCCPLDTKAVSSVVDDFPVISPGLLELGMWVSSYYVCGPGEVLKTMVPGRRRFSGGCPGGGARSAGKGPAAVDDGWMKGIRNCLERGKSGVYFLQDEDEERKIQGYLSLCALALSAGRQAIILAPDSASLGRLEPALRNVFGENLIIMHSGLAAGARRSAWLAARTGKAAAVLGLRSAVFAPLPDTGIIIVDRESDFTYKQKQRPKYSAPAVAEKRGEIEGFPVILQDSCPRFETGWRIKTEKVLSLKRGALPRRRPAVRVVDMRFESGKIISRELRSAVCGAMEEGEKSVLLLDRRGYSNCRVCEECGSAAKCLNCSVAMRYMGPETGLECLYCGASRAVPERCADCGNGRLRDAGFGTRRVETIARKIFPGADIARIDSDVSLSGAGPRAREADILIATRMGLNRSFFERAALTALVSAETTLSMPDFRAAENLFRVAARSAECMGGGGLLIIQTRNPGHYAVKRLRSLDYEGFFAEESVVRKKLGYPPFRTLVNMVFSGKDAGRVEASASASAEVLRKRSGHGIDILGPVPAAVSRRRGEFRYQMVVRSSNWEAAAEELAGLIYGAGRGTPVKTGVRLSVDVDAVDML